MHDMKGRVLRLPFLLLLGWCGAQAHTVSLWDDGSMSDVSVEHYPQHRSVGYSGIMLGPEDDAVVDTPSSSVVQHFVKTLNCVVSEQSIELDVRSQSTQIGEFQAQISMDGTSDLKPLRYVTMGLALFALIWTLTSVLLLHPTRWFYELPNFVLFFGALQGVAFSGMFTIPYPALYRTFSQSFAWSVGILTWPGLESTLTTFRLHRDAPTNPQNNDVTTTGIHNYVENQNVPYTNAFLTALIWWSLAMAAILAVSSICIILTFVYQQVRHTQHKYGLFSPLFAVVYPFFLLTYAACVLWSMYQFMIGDSWASVLLAGIVIGVFTIVILIGLIHTFISSITSTVNNPLFTPTTLRGDEYGRPGMPRYTGALHYPYRRRCLWWFLVIVLGSFGRGAFLGLGQNNAMVQIVGTLAIETVVLFGLIAFRPFRYVLTTCCYIFYQIIQVIVLVLFITFTNEVALSDQLSTPYAIALVTLQSVACIFLLLCLLSSTLVRLFHPPPPAVQTRPRPISTQTQGQGFAGASLGLPKRVREIPMMPSSPDTAAGMSIRPSRSEDLDRFALRNVSKSYASVHQPASRSEESLHAPVLESDNNRQSP
ncbi:hypothetical protein TRICI_003597 [Trichomonascus ciferrii]|uniref:TRP C-terminal domain-containing protein n=1 Tax=Trichomonascus ciferrii TaxID=44093 RepID=A0A642V3B6_9ASCO|nr:hypothetical protein TRICI_003597 [Trichomonascus ciferrii]